MSSMIPDVAPVAGRSAALVDEIGFDILRIVRNNGRISIASLAAEVGISRANAYSRIDAMTRAGIITGYSAQIDHSKVGLGITALVFCTIQPQSWREFLATVGDIPDVESAKITTGEHDVMLTVRSADVVSMQSLVIGTIAELPVVTRLETVMVLGELFQRPYVLPTDIPERPSMSVESGLMRYTRTDPGRSARV